MHWSTILPQQNIEDSAVSIEHGTWPLLPYRIIRSPGHGLIIPSGVSPVMSPCVFIGHVSVPRRVLRSIEYVHVSRGGW